MLTIVSPSNIVSKSGMTDLLLVAAIGVLIGLLACFKLWPQWLLRLRSRKWPTVSGTIEGGDVSVVRGRYGELVTATLSYSYSVDGQYYGGCDSQKFSNDEDGAWDYVNSPKGSSDLVAYNPHKHEMWVLR
jgi:hypothetical protein